MSPVLRCSFRQQAFTLLEMVLVILLISILGLIALDRILDYRVDVERVMIKTVVGNIRSALGLEIAERVVKNRTYTINGLEKSNPIKLLAQPPASYIGERPDDSQVSETGVWYFNTSEGALVYRVRFKEYFRSSLTGAPRVRHQIRMVYTDNNQNNRFDQGIDNIRGLDLVPLEDYEWEFPE